MQTAPFSLIAVFGSPEINFYGNTASVVFLENPLSDKKMQEIAAGFNQPATTYLWKGEKENQFNVRWFAPDEEIGLCGHGSLAAIAFLSEKYDAKFDIDLVFRHGMLAGRRIDKHSCLLSLKPIPVVSEETPSEFLAEALGTPVLGHYKTENKDIILTGNEEDVKKMQPDFVKLRQLETFGYAVTAPGNQVDFVSRTLVPHVQQLEDPATGSSHAALVPFWSQRLGKTKMIAHQLSKSGGKFICELLSDTVTLTGNFKVIATGKLR
jgi:predicted PhzF superfamily epimerase YddE/YHI9